MSKLNERCIQVIKNLIFYTNDSHTEYSLEDCQIRGDIMDKADELLDDLRTVIIFEEDEG